MPNFVLINQTIPDISRFQFFQDGGRSCHCVTRPFLIVDLQRAAGFVLEEDE